ncbi:hypothetical protein QQP08_026932 [Theobroma cacao]|nr:hypothetical protein QQP08_026932 [Theobroma cacao]
MLDGRKNVGWEDGTPDGRKDVSRMPNAESRDSGVRLSVTQKQQQISRREEAVKEKIILSQEKNIQRLNEVVRSLQQQLLQCKGNNKTTNGTASHLTEHVIELERQQVLED